MPIRLKNVVPWGRNYAEYCAMFALSAADLQKKILGCGDGPASFNATASVKGTWTVAVDPLYAFSAAQIQTRIEETYDTVIALTRQNVENFLWTHFRDVDHLGRTRMAAMQDFLADYGKTPVSRSGCYAAGELPHLPFAARGFELALCSHFLFLYSEQLDTDFHIAALRELCRVADAVRVFPLHTLENTFSPHVAPVMAALRDDGLMAEIVKVDYEFQRGGDEMLVVQRA